VSPSAQQGVAPVTAHPTLRVVAPSTPGKVTMGGDVAGTTTTWQLQGQPPVTGRSQAFHLDRGRHVLRFALRVNLS
jgi:hypothetical protein